MTTTKTVRQHRNRVIYPVSYCPQTYQAMKTLQERLKTSCGVQYSISVLARALGLMTINDEDTRDLKAMERYCKWCGSKTRKNAKSKGDTAR